MTNCFRPATASRLVYCSFPVRGVLWVAMAMLVTGMLGMSCAARLQQPEVTLAGVALGGVGFQGGTINVSLHVTNPNRFAMEASRVTYEFSLLDSSAQEDEWVSLASGVLDAGLRVEGRDSSVVNIPVAFRYSDISVALMAMLRSGNVNYRVVGEILVEKPVSRSVPYNRTGVFPLPDEG